MTDKPQGPEIIWARGGVAYTSPYEVYSCNRDGSNVVLAKDSPECTKYHSDPRVQILVRFIESITDATGPYQNLNGHRIVRDAYALLKQFKGEA